MILTLVSLVLAVLCYTVSQLQQHGKLRWMSMNYLYSFTGEWSYLRKYKRSHDDTGVIKYLRVEAPRNWYYKLIGSEYVEAWPTSTWLTVAFTDLYHLSQMFFKIFLALSFVPLTGWIWAGVIWFGWGIFFTIFYKLLSR